MNFLSWVISSSATRLICLILLFTPWLTGQAPEIDVVFHNGKILTVDEDFSVAEAVAISGGEFSAVGRNQDIRNLAGPGTLVIDLKGRTVIPGLLDTHRHIHMEAERSYGEGVDPSKLGSYRVDWRGVRTKQDVLDQIKGLMDKHSFQPGEWVSFSSLMSYGGADWPERLKIINDDLNRWELDKVTPDNPVALSIGIQEFNEYLVNSKAIEILWENYGDFIEKYGRYWVDSSGTPEGHLELPASRLVNHLLPGGSPDALATIYKKYIEELNAMGVTTVATRLPPNSLEAYQLLEASTDLTVRIAYGMEGTFGTVMDLEKDMEAFGKLIGTGTAKLWVISVSPTAADGRPGRLCTNQKRAGDSGSVDSKWWPQGQCFTDIEYRGGAGKGAPIQENYFREWLFHSARHGVRFANTHMAGDKTISVLLQMIAQIQNQMGPAATRGWVFDHCFMVDPADWKRAVQLGIMFSCYIRTERGPEVASYYGEQVAHTFMSPVKSLLAAGAKVVFESDRNVYVWEDLELFMTRVDRQGKVWGPQERVDRMTALKMITRWAAEYVLKEDKLGSIEPGKLADLVVLDRDYLTIPTEEVSEIQPQITVLDGKIIYVHPQFAEEYDFRPSGALVATYEELKSRRTSGPR